MNLKKEGEVKWIMCGTENTLGIHLVTFEGNWIVVRCTEPLPKSFESAERFYIVSCLLFRSQKKHFHRMAEFHYQPQLKVEIHLSQKLHSFKRKILNFLTPQFPTNKLKWTYNKPKIDPKWFEKWTTNWHNWIFNRPKINPN